MATNHQDVVMPDSSDNDSTSELVMPTIGSMSKSSSTKRTNRSPGDRTSSNHFAKQHKFELDPVLIIAGDSPFDRSNFIEFDSEIMEKTKARIKFTMLDRNNNLLIFVESLLDVERIMDCGDLFPYQKKVNLNLKDKRPKLIIKGLNFELANCYINLLSNEGVADIIDLSKNGYSPNIVKIIMENESYAEELLKKGSIKIKQYNFKVEIDSVKKVSLPKHNSYKSSRNQLENESSEPCTTKMQSTEKNSSGTSSSELTAFFSQLNSRLDSDKIEFKKNLVQELTKNKLEIDSTINEKLIKNNNNMISAFVEIFNSSSTSKIDKNKAKTLIANKCNKPLTDENDSIKLSLENFNTDELFALNQDEI